MNDVTQERITALIEQLAVKLGTTADHIWEILVRQAYIQAISIIFYTVLTVIAWIVWVKFHKYFSKQESTGKGYSESLYEKEGPFYVVPIVVFGALIFIFSIVVFVNLEDAISGALNPEYWALQQILNIFK